MQRRKITDASDSLNLIARLITSAHGYHHGCAIRKCRRDRYCTGPLVGLCDDGSLRLLVEAGADPGLVIVPACFLLRTNAEMETMAARIAQAMKDFSTNIDTPLPAPDRMLASRRYRKLSFRPDGGRHWSAPPKPDSLPPPHKPR